MNQPQKPKTTNEESVNKQTNFLKQTNLLKQTIMSKVKLTEVQKEKIAEFLSEQLHILKTEKRLGRIHYRDSNYVTTNNDDFLKSLEEAIRVGIAEEIWNR
jgi:hypothetical protein